ncbi:MAG TPA: hypothetical protein VLV50_13950 [Stellaceae bacterium]|nr:hypothetical protein [Stellaceae bacterium]
MTPRLALLLIVPLVALAPNLSSAADQRDFPDAQMMQQFAEAQRLARQAGEDMVRAMDALARAVPRYGMPYLDRDGNIVIPRVPRGTPVPDEGPSGSL